VIEIVFKEIRKLKKPIKVHLTTKRVVEESLLSLLYERWERP
jgi:hypothetical protein